MTETQEAYITTGENVASKCADAVSDLMKTHWQEIEDAIGDDPKMGVGATFTLRPEGGGWKIDTKLTFKKSYTNEREDYVDPPNQRQIPFEE